MLFSVIFYNTLCFSKWQVWKMKSDQPWLVLADFPNSRTWAWIIFFYLSNVLIIFIIAINFLFLGFDQSWMNEWRSFLKYVQKYTLPPGTHKNDIEMWADGILLLPFHLLLKTNVKSGWLDLQLCALILLSPSFTPLLNQN